MLDALAELRSSFDRVDLDAVPSALAVSAAFRDPLLLRDLAHNLARIKGGSVRGFVSGVLQLNIQRPLDLAIIAYFGLADGLFELLKAIAGQALLRGPTEGGP